MYFNVLKSLNTSDHNIDLFFPHCIWTELFFTENSYFIAQGPFINYVDKIRVRGGQKISLWQNSVHKGTLDSIYMLLIVCF